MEFGDFAKANGLLIKDFHPSQKVRRCPTTTHPKSTNGAYFWDGERGWTWAWDGDAEVRWYDNPGKPWSETDKADFKRQQAVARQAQQERYGKTVQKAQQIIKDAQRIPHDYLKEKGFPDELGFVIDESLYIPMRNCVTNALQGLQVVAWDQKWTKKMMSGMQAKNAVYWLGNRNALEVFLVEGYATGLSVFKAAQQMRLNAAVVVCFSANNMVTVSQQIKARKAVFADNDESKTGETAAQQIGRYVMSDVVGEDANDLMMRAGIYAVCKKLMELR